jgi:hypothetical protein
MRMCLIVLAIAMVGDRVQNRNVCPTRIVAWVVCATKP